MAQTEVHGVHPGTRVQVRNRFNHRWASGFEVAGVAHDSSGEAYQLLRLSDHRVLPVAIPEDDVRLES
jgi:hypothetical protein